MWIFSTEVFHGFKRTMCACVVTESCLTLCLKDCSPPGSSVYGISQQEFFTGVPFPTPRELPDPRIETTSPVSPALADRFFTAKLPGKQKIPNSKFIIGKLLLSHSVVSDSLQPHGLQHTRLSICRSLLKLMSLSQWCHSTIMPSVVLFSSCLQSFPASGSFLMSRLYTSGGQSIGVSASASALPMNIHNWFPLGWTGWTSLQSKGISRVFSNTTVQKHQFFGTQPSWWFNSHIHI